MAKERNRVRMQAHVKLMCEGLLDPCHCPDFKDRTQNGAQDLGDRGGRVSRADALDRGSGLGLCSPRGLCATSAPGLWRLSR